MARLLAQDRRALSPAGSARPIQPGTLEGVTEPGVDLLTTAHVREKPAARAPSLWELGAGYPLQVTQRKNGWLRVKDHEATLGWVHAPQTHKKPHMVITARSAQLRAGPGTQHKPLAKLDQHEVVRTLKKSGDWAQVQREGGQKGWISRRLAWGW